MIAVRMIVVMVMVTVVVMVTMLIRRLQEIIMTSRVMRT
jgi:hypothetical protein